MEQAQEQKKVTKKKAQCSSFLLCRGGLIVFCMKREQHDGDHRGARAQWKDGQKRVKITEPLAT